MKTNIRTFLTCPLSPGIVLTVQTLGPKHPNALDGKLLLAECCLDLGRIKDWKLSTFATHVSPADHFPLVTPPGGFSGGPLLLSGAAPELWATTSPDALGRRDLGGRLREATADTAGGFLERLGNAVLKYGRLLSKMS